jgi:hypothetical protein
VIYQDVKDKLNFKIVSLRQAQIKLVIVALNEPFKAKVIFSVSTALLHELNIRQSDGQHHQN